MGELSGADGTGWNNTWGDDEGLSGDDLTVDAHQDDETRRRGEKTTALVIRQLARRGMSRWEVEQALTRKDIAPEVFGPELDRLQALGIIDDGLLASSLAFAQHTRKGLGRSEIERELQRRHIEPELIAAALDEIAEDNELEKATELAIKRIGQLSAYDDATARRRLNGFLARKGYDSGVVRQAMDAAFATRRGRGVRFE